MATPSGAFCDQQCFSEGLTSSQFKKIGTTLSTFACGVSDPSVGTVSGYQLSNGSATCSVASPTNAIVSPQYSCLCQVNPYFLAHRPEPHLETIQGLHVGLPQADILHALMQVSNCPFLKSRLISIFESLGVLACVYA